MSSLEEPRLVAPVPSAVLQGQLDQTAGTHQKDEKKVTSRGWLALGVFFLTAAVGYGLMFLMIDNWLKG